MKAPIATKMLLFEVLKRFEEEYQKGYPNQKYLEQQVARLEQMCIMFHAQARDRKLPPRIRARARDLEQNALGLINGIKFGISFWLHKDLDLSETDPVAKVDEANVIH